MNVIIITAQSTIFEMLHNPPINIAKLGLAKGPAPLAGILSKPQTKVGLYWAYSMAILY